MGMSEAAAISDRVGAFLTGADADQSIDVGDPDLAVADLASGGRTDDRVHHGVDLTVVDDDLDGNLGNEVDLVLRTSVRLGVATLAAEPAHLGDGHAGDGDRLQGVLD